MLDAVASLGEYLIENYYKERITEIFIDSRALKNVKYVFSIVLEKTNGTLRYDCISLEGLDSENLYKYLYKTHPSNRFDISPTAKRNFAKDNKDKIKKEVEKAMDRIVGWFSHERFSKYKEKYPVLSKIEQALKDNENSIIEEITTKAINIDKKDRKNVLVTLKLIDKNREEEKYIGEIREFKDIFLKEAPEDLYNKKSFGGISKGIGMCYICGRDNIELWGFASPFNFFSVDKPGFAPEFSQLNSWKMLPICKDCAIKLQAGRRFLDEYTQDTLYGYSYYVVPRIHNLEQREEVIQDIINYKHKMYYEITKEMEEDLLDFMKETGDFVTLIFLFVQKNQSREEIHKYVEDIPPSWIKRIYTTFDKVRSFSIFQESTLKKIFGDSWEGNIKEHIISECNSRKKINMIAFLIRKFFPNSKETGVYDKYFLDVLGDIIAQNPINKKLLYKSFIREIKNAFVNNSRFEYLTLYSFLFYLFLLELDLVGGEKMDKKELEVKKGVEKIENFFERFNGAFNTPEKKAAFLEGVLTRFLLDWQYANRGSTPFKAKLYSLNLDEKRLKKLLVDIEAKLMEYDLQYSWLKELIAKYLVEAGANWKLSKEEISYYFVLGLSLGRMFKSENDNEQNSGGDENE